MWAKTAPKWTKSCPKNSFKKQYKTTITDFGCIPHSELSYIGASPDGINTNPQSDRYGRMLEVKNIVNREINGIPKMDYWIQMQLQLEVCDLNYCDFLETKFTEYEDREEFDNDGNFRLDEAGHEIGKDILIQKARGYISFVRGENPYLFPYRIYPTLFSSRSIRKLEYPSVSLNGKSIIQPIHQPLPSRQHKSTTKPLLPAPSSIL